MWVLGFSLGRLRSVIIVKKEFLVLGFLIVVVLNRVYSVAFTLGLRWNFRFRGGDRVLY